MMNSLHAFVCRLAGLLLLVLLCGRLSAQSYQPRAGDLIFQTSRSRQSEAIQLATHSHFSHMGIIFKGSKGWHVFEAVQPVKETPLKEWVRRGVGGHFTVRRLKDADRLLHPKALARMRKEGLKFRGKNYDLAFGWTDNRIYCSELVYKIYQRALGIPLGKLQRLRDFDLTSPVVKKLMAERYRGKIPLDEPVISPQAVFDAEQLVTVFEN